MDQATVKLVFIYISVIFALAILNQILFPSKKRKISGKKRSVRLTEQKNSSKKKVKPDDIMNSDIDSLSGTDFEKLIAMYYTDQGYKVKIVGGSGDNEVDLIMEGKEGYKIAVQCKRWKNNVGNDIVLRLKAGKQFHGCYDGWIITTSHFTKDAQIAAEKLNIKLINGIQTYDMISRWKKKKALQNVQ